MTVLRVSKLGKAFLNYRSELRRILSWFGLKRGEGEKHWVLKNVDFAIGSSESLALIGSNGAGKSTLLKLIAGTLKPTEGSIEVNGRIAAILELGMGFNPDLTGRQNVEYGLGLWGFGQHEIREVLPQVEAFAEVGEYFDQPIRTYSSGMQMRVAFSVATAFRPQILIVDEALAVGDSYFQHKCIDRIRKFQDEGTSLILVSHDQTAIHALCQRAIFIGGGEVCADGKVDKVLDLYNAVTKTAERDKVEQRPLAKTEKVQTIFGTGGATVSKLELIGHSGKSTELVSVGEDLELRVSVLISRNISSLVFGYAVKDRYGQIIYGTNTRHSNQIVRNLTKGSSVRLRVKFPANFGPSSYSIQVALVSGADQSPEKYQWIENALVFDVVNSQQQLFTGCCWNEPVISIKKT